METFFMAARTLLYMAAFIAFFGWVAVRLKPLDPGLDAALPAPVRMLGVATMIVGALLTLACAWVFIVRGRGTPAVFDPPRQFVAAGPYRFVRNPMYLGGMLLLGGFGLHERSLSMVGFAIAMFGLLHLFVVFVEEPGLERRFGESYRAYKLSVNRWLPKFSCSFARHSDTKCETLERGAPGSGSGGMTSASSSQSTGRRA